MVQDSEFLETHLIAVPNAMTREYLKAYESLAPMVVPRSSIQLASDSEFTLYAVTTFKKHSAEFLHKCREKRWTPRDFKYVEGGRESEAKEIETLAREEKKVWGEALRLGRTGYSESAMVLVHVLALRVFVETVLRYGLPLDFVSGIIQVRVWRQLARSLTSNRQHQNKPRRRRRISTPTTLIWRAMLLGKIRRAASRKTTKPWPPKFRQRQGGVRSTLLSCITSSNWNDCVIQA
jgi:V-ATPase subunit C